MNTGLLRPAVATTPTVYGIETLYISYRRCYVLIIVATTPTVYGIETLYILISMLAWNFLVATTPTVYGIETNLDRL